MKHFRPVFALTASLAGLFLSIHASAELPTSAQQKSMAYVLEASSDCTLGDGFKCKPISENQISLNQQQMVPAIYLQAWPVAYADFLQLASLDEAQKRLAYYKIGFAEEPDNFIVIFHALLLPELDVDGQATGRLMRAGMGPSMRYKINKQSLGIIERKRYR